MYHDHLKGNLLKLLLKCQRKKDMKSRENVTCKTQCICMVILNYIGDNDHYSVYTNQIDLKLI